MTLLIKKLKKLIFQCTIFVVALLLLSNSQSKNKDKKIISVHSYSADFPWTRMIVDSYEGRLKKGKIPYTIQHYYLDVKKKPVALDTPHLMLKQIEEDLSKNLPDLVFITDDFALNQLSTFLVNKKIPFTFAGINGDIPQAVITSKFKSYSGVFERYYIADSLHLLQKLLGRKKLKVQLLLEASETSDFVLKYAKEELKKVSEISTTTLVTNEFKKWQALTAVKPKEFDAFFILQPFSLRDESNNYVPTIDVVSWFAKNSTLPVLYTGGWQVKCGGTLSIAIRPRMQGFYAAEKSIEVLKGIFSEPLIPPQGDIEINYQSTEKLRIKIPFDLLTSATIDRKIQVPCDPK